MKITSAASKNGVTRFISKIKPPDPAYGMACSSRSKRKLVPYIFVFCVPAAIGWWLIGLMRTRINNAFFLDLLVSSDYRLRLVRHALLWSTALLLIYNGFDYIATRSPQLSSDAAGLYSVLSTLLFGGLTITAYWIITTLTHRFILLRFQLDRFLVGILLVHVVSSIIVLWHFNAFIYLLGLSRLPNFYALYANHVARLPVWRAPFDSIIVGFFSFSLFYNYLLYAVGFKIFKDLFALQLRQIKLENENLRLEFEFLKAQINPHFLFNTLNNIYSFSIRSPHRVADTILKLADLMRYALYETNDEFVLLDKELTFLRSYVALQRIRHDDNVQIEFVVNGQPGSWVIPPLLLVVFVENAFKHGIQSSARASWVGIQVDLAGQSLTLQVHNSVPPRTGEPSGGIGLRNVRKRLDHYYADHYQLTVQEPPNQFQVTLTLNVDAANVPRPHRR